jgi:hypothetical protein
MQISWHTTCSVFERYNIVSEGDLREAARRIADYHAANGNIAIQEPSPAIGGTERSTTHGPAAR